MANIGSTLLEPEQGWKRYNNTDSRIKYVNKWTINNNVPTAYNNTGCITNYRHGENGTLEFRFTGTKIRLIVPGSDASHTNKCTVEIDGEKFISSQCTPTLVHPNYIYQMLFFEKLDLTDRVHTVKIYIELGTMPPVSASYGDNYLALDAIDIDVNESLLHHTLEQNNSIQNIQIGEYIPCDYTYEDCFSNFGTGKTLNFICVEHNLSQSILISDTVIPNLSFDEINNKGFIYGNALENQPYEDYLCVVKSITDSPYNDNYLHSEYDKYILNSTLNDLITAGDKDIWHHNLASITDTFSHLDNSKVTIRGGANSYNMVNTSVKNDASGFRPVLIIKKLYFYPEFDVNYTFGECNGIINLINISLDKIIDIPKIKVKVINKSNDKEVLYTNLLDVTEESLNINIINTDLLNGLNLLEIIIEDENNYISESKTLKVFKHDEGITQYTKMVITNNILFDKEYESMKVKLKSNGSIIGIYTIDNTNYSVFNINSIVDINSNNINLLLLMDKDSVLNAYKIIFEDKKNLSFDNTILIPLPTQGTGGDINPIDKEEVIKIINETVNPKLDLINKNLNLSDLKIQLKYDKELSLAANYTSNYYIDTKLDTVEREGE